MAVETVPMDDTALFNAAMADEPTQVEQPVEERPAEAEPERQRDELGRFAPKQEATQAEAAPIQQQAPVDTTKDDTAGQVPSWRLREVSEARAADRRLLDEQTRQFHAQQAENRALQQQLADLQKPKREPVDFFANPDEAIQERLSPIQQEMERFKTDIRLEMSREVAVIRHGEPLIAEMEQAIAKAMAEHHPDMPSLAAKMRVAQNPASVALQWYKNSKLLDETGGDLAAYRQKILDEAMKDPAFQGKVLEASRATAGQQQNGTRPNIQLPPSLNRAPGSAGNSADLSDADMGSGALFKHAVAPRRTR